MLDTKCDPWLMWSPQRAHVIGGSNPLAHTLERPRECQCLGDSCADSALTPCCFLPQVCYKRDWHDLIAKGNNVLADAIPITAAKSSRNIASDVSRVSGEIRVAAFFRKFSDTCLLGRIQLMSSNLSTKYCFENLPPFQHCRDFSPRWLPSVEMS